MERLPKREYPIERVIGPGFDEEDYEIALKFLRGRFGRQDFLSDIEREKTEEEKEIIGWVNDETNSVLEACGVRPLDLPAENIHIIPEEHWPKNPEDKESAAFYDFGTQSILYRDAPWRSLLAFRLFHEELHLKSHQAVQYVEEDGKKKLEQYRSGLGLASKKRDNYELQFRKLNEAVIETLAINFWEEKITTNERFRKEMEALTRVRAVLRAEKSALRGSENLSDQQVEQLVEEVCAALPGEPGKEEPEVVRFSYPFERVALVKLIFILAERSPDGAKDEGAIFELFVKSVLSGHMVELGKLIDRTLGAGTFKRLGEMSSGAHTREEFLEYVKGL